jgi:hypothetical protein
MLSKGISLTRRLPTKPTVISACVGLFETSLLLAAFKVGASAPTLQVGDIPPDASESPRPEMSFISRTTEAES